MSEIKAGDLVVLVHAGCKHAALSIGKPFTVSELRHATSACYVCRDNGQIQDCWHVLTGKADARSVPHGYPIAWVRKIEPLADPESALREQEFIV